MTRLYHYRLKEEGSNTELSGLDPPRLIGAQNIGSLSKCISLLTATDCFFMPLKLAVGGRVGFGLILEGLADVQPSGHLIPLASRYCRSHLLNHSHPMGWL